MKKHWIGLLLPVIIGTVCTPKVPEKWQNLGIPSDGLIKVYNHSNEHGFYADYKGNDPDSLLQIISNKMSEIGYSEVCSQFEGMVKGFQKNEERYIVKAGEIGDRIPLSVFDENGSEPLLFDVCFKGYKLGEPVLIK